MSYHDYVKGRELTLDDPPFYALIQAAMRKADTGNLEKLQAAFPEIWEELNARYHAPGADHQEKKGGERYLIEKPDEKPKLKILN